MMQYVQWNEQPSCTLMNARVRSTRGASPGVPSIATPASVGSGPARTPVDPGATTSGPLPPAPLPPVPPPWRCGPPTGPAISRPTSATSRSLAALSTSSATRIVGGVPGRVHRHRTPGEDQDPIRARAAGPAGRLPRLFVGNRRHAAGVDDVEVHPGAVGDQADPPRAQQARHLVHLGLVDLAAEIRDRGAPDRAPADRRGPCVDHR